MLNCKQFVERATDAEEYQMASFGQKIQIKFHMFMCHHCRKYNEQFRTTTVVAKNLTLDDTPDVIIEEAVVEMKEYSVQDNSSIN